MGKIAVGSIFQAGNGKPLNLDNLVRRVIKPTLAVSKIEWHGWHAFRRGLATNLHALRVDDKTIQAILRHSNIGLTQNLYVKSVGELGITAMNLLEAELRKETCNKQQRACELNFVTLCPAERWMVGLGRVELPTCGLGNRCSIHLSYRPRVLSS